MLLSLHNLYCCKWILNSYIGLNRSRCPQLVEGSAVRPSQFLDAGPKEWFDNKVLQPGHLRLRFIVKESRRR